MARPTKLINPQPLNLLMNAKAKAHAQKLAFQRNISVGLLLEQLVVAEMEKAARRKSVAK